MLPRSQRLNKMEVAQTIAKGRSLGDRRLSLRLLAAADTAPSRLAVVVSSRQIKLAADRHLVKRRLRALIRQLAPELLPGFRLVIFCGADCRRLGFGGLRLELLKRLSQAKVLK